jgi:magnesium and cobalt transporter
MPDLDESGDKPSLLDRISALLAREPETRDELLGLLRGAFERRLLDADALSMIEGVLSVSETTVRDIMIPRAQMDCVSIDDEPGDFIPLIVETKHSRFPVIGESKDDVVGILLAKELLNYYADPENFNLRDMLRPAVFVPESKRLNVLLKEFRRNRNHMAIVVDEYGGVSGLCTIEDVIEQIVGEIDDEFDVEDDQNIRRDAEAQFTVRGVTRIDEFNQFFGAQLPEGEGVDTIAGLLLKQLGRLPRRGEAASIDGFEFRVLRADRRRIDTLRVLAPRDVLPPADERSSGGTS